jgi:sugar transferase EpsL
MMDADAAAGTGGVRGVDSVPTRGYRGKRVMDFGFLVLVIGPVVIVAALCAVAVACTSRGPVLFRQERVGRSGRLFIIVKFRTMIDNPDGNALVPDEAEVTAVGRLLRRTSLDELPQLWNVLWGDMSVVGPRPTLSYQVERYDSRQRTRLDVRPGLTGLAQVEGRNELSWAERIEWDLDYVARSSLWLDLSILVRTVPALLGRSGVSGHSPDDPLSMPEPGVDSEG